MSLPTGGSHISFDVVSCLLWLFRFRIVDSLVLVIVLSFDCPLQLVRMALAASISKILDGLDSDVKEYVVATICGTDDGGNSEFASKNGMETLLETVIPFLQSAGFVETDEEGKVYCEQIHAEVMKAHGSEEDSASKGPKKLESSVSMGGGGELDNELTRSLWGMSKHGVNANSTMEKKVAISARQARIAVKKEKQLLVKEEHEAEMDAAWEDEKILPNMEDLGKAGEVDIHVANFTMTFKGQTLISNGSLKFVYGRRYGLMGRNGAGKTTLLRHIARYEIEGLPRHLRITMVDQEAASKMKMDSGSVLDTVLNSDYELKILKSKAKDLEAILNVCEAKNQAREAAERGVGDAASDTTSETTTAAAQDCDDVHDENEVANELKEIYDRMQELDSETAESRARVILCGLQFTPEMIDSPAAMLSG